MTQVSANTSRNPAPSLYKLVSGIPQERLLRHSADALVVIGRQLELLIQEEAIPADVAIGTLRFSLFRLHQGRIAQMAPSCRSVTVYGEADEPPPQLDGVQFVELPRGTPLTQEWFVLVDSPAFWGALMTRIVPERNEGRVRRYLFEGALTADERTVSRANLLLNLIQPRNLAPIGQRDQVRNRMHWARVAYGLMTHSESERLQLAASLRELPDMLDLLTASVGATPESLHQEILPQALQALRHYAPAGATIYRYEQNQLRPLVWSGPQQPETLSLNHGISGQAVQRREPVLAALSPGDPEHTSLPSAQSVVAAPLLAHGQPWGVLTVGQPETDPTESPVAPGAVGIAALLSEILGGMHLDPTAAAPIPAEPPPAPPQSPPLPQSIPAPAAPPPAAAAAQPAAQPAESAAPPNSSDAGAFGLPAWMRSGTMQPPPMPHAAAAPAVSQALPDENWDSQQRNLMSALIAFDRRTAEHIWEEVTRQHTIEEVCTELLMPVQIAVGEGWHRGEISVAAEHFTSRFVEGKMLNILNAGHDNPSAPMALIGCAQAEMHEIGAIMLALFLRWEGFRIVYLGQNVPNSTLPETLRQLRPQVLGLSASTVESAHNLTEVGHIVARMEPPRPQFIFGGLAFYERPDLRSRIQGQFLEGDIRKIARKLAQGHQVT